MTREAEQMVMIQSELADDDETDQPAQELRGKIDKLMAEFVRNGAIVQNWNFEFEHKQRHHNREHAVAERFDSAQPQLALRKAF